MNNTDKMTAAHYDSPLNKIKVKLEPIQLENNNRNYLMQNMKHQASKYQYSNDFSDINA